jgi:tRNA nucleotidyltransferase/poly(A) polymerase
MADYIYTMETRLTPEQQRAIALVQDIARAQELNLYLTGGTIRDLVTGFPIRDIDLTVQGNPLKLQKELERHGAIVQGVDEDLRTLYLLLPGNVRAEMTMARTERYEKTGRPPVVAPATITEDLRRRDFTVNAMALSLNPGSRGLLLDPSNGAADIEAKLLRILHNYAFVEDPSRLIRATRFAARFHWPLEERTQARYDAAKENNYIEHITNKAIGCEIEQLAYEDDPLHILRALEKEGWLKVLHPHWTLAKVDTADLGKLLKSRQAMTDLGYSVDTAPAVMYFLTRRLSERDIAEIQRLIPRKQFVETWRRLEDDAKELAKKLSGKDAATPSRAWKVLQEAKPETILFLDLTTKNQSVAHKITNFFGKWRQLKDKLPLPEMAELHITPQLPEYPKIADEAFHLLLDGKLRSRTEILKFLKPYAPPPPPPPPPPPKRGRGAKQAEAVAPPLAAAVGKKGGKKAKAAAAIAEAVAPKVRAAVEKSAPPAPTKVKAAASVAKPPAKLPTKKPAPEKVVAKKAPPKEAVPKRKGTAPKKKSSRG